MNKKGYLLLFISALGFLSGIILYIYYSGNYYYPGTEVMNLVELHKEEQNVLLFFDESIKMSAALAVKETGRNSQQFSQVFKNHFEKYLDGFNKTYNEDLSISNFNFRYEYYPDKIIINAKSNNPIFFKTDSKFRYEETLMLDVTTEYKYK